ncbi:MFS transporter [Hwanghaeella sp.]|uniref:MFS transporter n=1 Tax=Hwanghaeella sp. TaxID=2605943 RepID=UPI003CCC07A3
MIGYFGFIRANARLLGFGGLLCLASSFGQTFFISLFSAEIRAEFSLSDGEFGAVYSLGTLASAFLLLWTGQLIDRVDLRFYIVAVFTGLGLAAVLMSLTHSVVLLVFIVFLLRQCGQGLPGHTAMTAMGRYFDQGRGKALSIAALGYPIGEALLPLAVVATVAAIGWRESWAGIAAVLALVVVPLALLLLGDQKARHGAYLERMETAERDAAAGRGSAERSWTRAEVLRDPRLYLVLPGLLAPSFIFTGLFFHQILIIVDIQGWSKTALAASYPIYAVTTVAASLLAGVAIDRFGAARLLPWFLWPQMLAVVVLISGTDPVLLIPYMVLTGAGTGVTHTLASAFWPEVYGRRHLGAIRALATALMVFSSAASPVAMGILFDIGLSLTAVGWMLIGYALVGIALCTIAARLYLTAGRSTATAA